jgi:hypothetical protein
VSTNAWLLLALAAVLAGWATQAIVSSGLFERRQLIVQVLIAWLVPVAGPIVLLTVVRAMKAQPTRRPSSDTDHDRWDDARDGAHHNHHGQAD